MPANGIIPTPGTNLLPTFLTPGANTNHPLTKWRFGNATTTPPSQYSTVPSRSVQHQTPVAGLSVKSQPESDFFCHLGRLAAARDRHAHRSFNLSLGASRSSASGCSFEIIKTRTPPSNIARAFRTRAAIPPPSIPRLNRFPQGRDRGRKILKRVTYAGQPDRYRRALRWCRHYDMEGTRTHGLQCQFSEMNV